MPIGETVFIWNSVTASKVIQRDSIIAEVHEKNSDMTSQWKNELDRTRKKSDSWREWILEGVSGFSRDGDGKINIC